MKIKVAPSNLLIIAIFVAIFSFMQIKKCHRLAHPMYTIGISKGVVSGVKGNLTLDYTFTANGEEFKGFVSSDFFSKCPKCCIAGDSVIVRYETDNPDNNDLVVKVPDGESLQ